MGLSIDMMGFELWAWMCSTMGPAGMATQNKMELDHCFPHVEAPFSGENWEMIYTFRYILEQLKENDH